TFRILPLLRSALFPYTTLFRSVDGLRAVIVHGAPKLPDVLDDHVHAVGVPLAQVATRRVVGALATQLDDPAADIIAALALLTERSEEHTSELQSRVDLVCRLLL